MLSAESLALLRDVLHHAQLVVNKVESVVDLNSERQPPCIKVLDSSGSDPQHDRRPDSTDAQEFQTFSAIVPPCVSPLNSLASSSSSSDEDQGQAPKTLQPPTTIAVRRPSIVSQTADRQMRGEAKNMILQGILQEDSHSVTSWAAEHDTTPGLTGSSVEKVRHSILSALSGQDIIKAEPMHWFGRIANTVWFEWVTVAMILANIVWQCIDLELNDDVILYNAHWTVILIENLFCIFFSCELAVRLLSYPTVARGLKDARFVFDVVLVVFMVTEVWVVSPILAATTSAESSNVLDKTSVLRIGRVLRVLRTARMARLVAASPELLVLMKGMLMAIRSVFFTLVLLCIITYVFAITFMMLAKGSELENIHFRDTGAAMWILVSSIVLPDQGRFLTELGSHGWEYGGICILFTLISYLTVLNMLTGILVEVVKNVTAAEKELRDITVAQRTLLSLNSGSDLDDITDTSSISKHQFMMLLSKPQAVKTLSSIGVDVLGTIDLIDVLYERDAPLPFSTLMHHMLMLRGSNIATVKDMVDMRKFVSSEFDQLYEMFPGGHAFTDLLVRSPGNSSAEQENKRLSTSSQGRPGVLSSQAAWGRQNSSFLSVESSFVEQENSRIPSKGRPLVLSSQPVVTSVTSTLRRKSTVGLH